MEKKRKISSKKKLYLNREDTLLVVLSYPDPTSPSSQNLLKKLARDHKLLVLTQKDGQKKVESLSRRIVIHRVWKRGNPFSLFTIFPYLFKYDKIHKVFFQFELDTFGVLTLNLFLPLILLTLNGLKKRVYFEMNQKNTDLKALLMPFYKMTGIFAYRIIVFKSFMKEQLTHLIEEDKIMIFPRNKVTYPVK